VQVIDQSIDEIRTWNRVDPLENIPDRMFVRRWISEKMHTKLNRRAQQLAHRRAVVANNRAALTRR
jgi:TPP-dependent pyruvate/acetoin dehydrogenase alpha subunit